MDGEMAATPYMPPNRFGVNPKYWERIQNMRLMDDTLLTAAMDDNIEATQFILRLLMEKEDLVVTSVRSQVEIKNLYGRSQRMDVDATDSENDLIDVEVERVKYRATPERSRYYLAVRDSHSLDAGEDFKELPTTYLIFITEKDYYGKSIPLYHIDRVVKECDTDFNDRAHIIYVNGAYEGDDRLGHLLADFRQSDPGKMHYPELARRVHALKNSEKEVKKMCKAMEDTFEEGRKEGRKEGREEGEQTRGVRDVESLMETLGLSIADALRALRIPAGEQQTYTNLIAQRQPLAGQR